MLTTENLNEKVERSTEFSWFSQCLETNDGKIFCKLKGNDKSQLHYG